MDQGKSMPGLFDRLQQEIDQRERMEGLSPADLLDLPDDLRRLLLLLARHGDMGLAEVAAAVDIDSAEVSRLLATLVDRGFILERQVGSETRYRTYFGHRRTRDVPLNIWDALSDRTDEE